MALSHISPSLFRFNLNDKCKQILEEANIKYTNEKGYSNWEITEICQNCYLNSKIYQF